jgi:small subunit ribosomal protein S7
VKKVKYVNPFSYNDPLHMKFVTCIMKSGKKTIAERILRDTFDEIDRRGATDTKALFEKAYANATPTMEVKPKRIGGGIYQIPLEVPPKRQQSLAIRWILMGARKRKGMPMYKRLAMELMDSASETGFAFGKREDAHRMAAANKAFAHLARY